MEDNDGTTVIGMLYDQGALILADTQISGGTTVRTRRDKVYSVEENMVLASSGISSTNQKVKREIKHDLLEFRRILENDFAKEAKDKKEFMLTETKDGVELNDVSKDLDGIIHAPCSVVYQVANGDTILEIGSVVAYLGQIIESTKPDAKSDVKSHIVVAGWDRDGPKLHEVYFEATHECNDIGYAVLGTGAGFTKPWLEGFYEKGMSLEKALQLAVFSALKAEKGDTASSRPFTARVVYMRDGKIRSRKIGKETIDKYVQAMINVKPKFPFVKFGMGCVG